MQDIKHFRPYQVISALVFTVLWSLCTVPAHSQVNGPVNNTGRTDLEELGRSLQWWDEVISKKPYSWYRSDEGLQAARNILSWQDNGAGWPLMSTVREAFSGDSTKAGPFGMRAALVKSTVNEMRFLARGFTATRDSTYRTAVLGALQFLLDAQLDCGGWPQTFPHQRSTYSHYATFNDDVTTDIMTLLEEILDSPDFKLIGKDNLENVRRAFDKGLSFILGSQIVINGKRTAWAQQYDARTLEPRPARPFEPAAISGGESAAILHFLMRLRNPGKEVIEAVDSGIQWYRDVQINGVEVIRTPQDRIVRANPQAPPVWARYYEIGTNRPIFAGRDGVIRYQLAEIEQERRRGYAWYNYHGTALYERYRAWKYERMWDHLPATNTEESEVRDFSLPDPLLLENGQRVSSITDWQLERRPEILAMFEQHQFGRSPDTTIRTSFEIVEQGVLGMGGKSHRTQVRVRFPDYPMAQPIRILLNIPAIADGPVPVLLHLSFTPNILLFDEPGIDEGLAWDRRLEIQIPDREARVLRDTRPEHLVDHGYGIATVYYGDIEPDFDHGGRFGVRAMFSGTEPRQADSWGSIGAWAWGLSKVMDYLQTDVAVDGDRIALSGVSRLGKTALWAAALDPRFAMVIPMVSGEGGAAISRRNYGETVADLTNPYRYDYWFAPRYADYAFDVDNLPVDAHMLLALLAPRPVLQIVGSTDTWSDPRGEWISAQAASPVYALFGLEGVEHAPEPKPGDKVLHDMGFFMHDGGHTVLPEDLDTLTDFMDQHFRQ